MRQEREPKFLVASQKEDERESDESEEDDVVAQTSRTNNAFAMMHDFPSSDEEDKDDVDVDDKEDDDVDDEEEEDEEVVEGNTQKVSPEKNLTSSTNNDPTMTNDEDLDALLQEYKLKDNSDDFHTDKSTSSSSTNYYSVITAGMDPRDLDIDYVMRTSLMGTGTDGINTSNKTRLSRRGNRQVISLFGPPKEEWPRPPNYVGGGIGMVSYDDWNQDESNTPLSKPWPYSEFNEIDERCPPTSQWFTFSFSDNYQRDLSDFEIIQASGDANALAMFVAHHPYIVQALLQLSQVLYQTRRHQEGLSILKRTLWVLECAALNSFLKLDQQSGFLSYELEENQPFFDAVYRLIRVSYMGGLARTALAASRLLLSLDPLLDPMNVLLSMDYFALACNMESCDQWLVKLVESNRVSFIATRGQNLAKDVCGQGELVLTYVVLVLQVNVMYSEQDIPSCDLLDMPNWSFSYALALFRIHEKDRSDKDTKNKADTAIQTALFRFPTVIGQILSKNEVKTNLRSFQIDWPSVLGFVKELCSAFQNTASDNTVKARSFRAYESIVLIFVQQIFNLWSPPAVMKWVYDNLQIMKETKQPEFQRTSIAPAILRYARCDPRDFMDKFQTMPADINPLDPSVVAHSLTVDTNRPRLLQRGPRGT
jgi:hypothetical protein